MAARTGAPRILPVSIAVLALVAILGCSFSGAFLAGSPKAAGLRGLSVRDASIAAARASDDPYDFVGQTGKRIEANSENERLVDTDDFWAWFYTIGGAAATWLFVTVLYSTKPGADTTGSVMNDRIV
eukprot:TRINITY_DN11657_c0_g2_i1.p1 TRINITY_DN11657_c0_g2~~TRINITY_DN11657_c0_g2_i1.p1  ORF type:complete len:127 (+),score=25.80 TRINITY_DN11657_c0_g2_i1:88-468(+)